MRPRVAESTVAAWRSAERLSAGTEDVITDPALAVGSPPEGAADVAAEG